MNFCGGFFLLDVEIVQNTIAHWTGSTQENK